MKIVLIDRDAFVDIGDGYLIYIGSTKEVQASDANRISDMIQVAIHVNRFREMHSVGQRLH